MAYASSTFQQPKQFPPSWRPNPGESIEGMVKSFSFANDKFKPGQRVQICNLIKVNGQAVSVWINHAHLKELFGKSFPEIGERIRIERLADEKPTGGYVKAMYRLTRESTVEATLDQLAPVDPAEPPRPGEDQGSIAGSLKKPPTTTTENASLPDPPPRSVHSWVAFGARLLPDYGDSVDPAASITMGSTSFLPKPNYGSAGDWKPTQQELDEWNKDAPKDEDIPF